jgi:predicted adenine nucleotide alpha hydrolase (AANH) superfamily ATPase
MNQDTASGIDSAYAGLLSDEGEPGLERQTLLLHSCCGPCSTAVVERLARDHDITIFFYNPNITDEDEYRRRLEAQRAFVSIFNSSPDAPSRVNLVVGPYEPGVFLKICEGLEDEPEGGVRCEKCISLRLMRAVEYASMRGFRAFSTTLSVSPRKNHQMICVAGNALMLQYGVDFLADDFKKCGGCQRSVELAKAYGLYRQNYCGCEFARASSEDEPVLGTASQSEK